MLCLAPATPATRLRLTSPASDSTAASPSSACVTGRTLLPAARPRLCYLPPPTAPPSCVSPSLRCRRLAWGCTRRRRAAYPRSSSSLSRWRCALALPLSRPLAPYRTESGALRHPHASGLCARVYGSTVCTLYALFTVYAVDWFFISVDTRALSPTLSLFPRPRQQSVCPGGHGKQMPCQGGASLLRSTQRPAGVRAASVVSCILMRLHLRPYPMPCPAGSAPTAPQLS